MTQNLVKKMNLEIRKNTEFLSDLFIDQGVISGEPSQCVTEVGKRALDIYYQFETKPGKITFEDLDNLVKSKNSQISNPDRHLQHLKSAATLLKSIVKTLGSIYPDLDLPTPELAYATGLVHDLNATFSDYGKTGQQTHELDGFFLATRLNFFTMRNHVTLHSDYIGVARLIANGVYFPEQEVYKGMKATLNGFSSISYQKIADEFAGFLSGKENLSLILLTVADYAADGRIFFTGENFNEAFDMRTADIESRYCQRNEVGHLSLIGQALMSGGMQRIKSYKELISMLLNHEPYEIERLRQETNFFL